MDLVDLCSSKWCRIRNIPATHRLKCIRATFHYNDHLQWKRFFCDYCYEQLVGSDGSKCVCGNPECTKAADPMRKIIARRERKAAKIEEEQQMEKLFQEERRARQEELARKEQEAKLRMAREKMKLLALQRAPKRQDPLPQRKPLSQQEKVAIAEFVAKKEEEKRAQALGEKHDKMMEKCYQDIVAHMQ